MPLEALFSAIAEAVFGYLLQESDLAERARAVLGLDPERRAFQTALARAYIAFARRYPEWTASLFDETFLKSEPVLPLLAELLTRRGRPDPPELARRFAAHLGHRDPDRWVRLSEATRAAADLLTWLEAELARQEVLQPLYDSRALERIAENTEAIRRALEENWQKALAEARQIWIAGNVTGSILIVGDHNIVQGITSLPTDYGTRIRNFILEYTDTPERPVPFGGREEALQALDRWLDDPTAPPYLLLAAPAGRGKSALLVRWLERRRQHAPDLPVVFVPVSLRYETASQAVFFAALAARLAHLFDEKVPADLSQAPDIWRGMASGYLSRPAPDGRLLVVLDGLDEATDWQAGPDLFPFRPPPGLRVVVSARHLAGERGPEGWLRRLGWDGHRLARPLDLAPLAREGVADVLQSMGFPLDELGRRVDIVAELHRLSEGDPLLVRLYVDDLWARGEAAARLRPEDLRSLRPGLEGYFDRWWEDQRKQWGEKAPLKEPAVREVLDLLAAALAPLGQEDLLALSGLNTWTLAEALRPLARLVVGDGKGQGYAFSHPRLGQYFWEKLSRGERQALERRFLDWGLEGVERLRRGEMAPREVSPYLVRALGSHLARAGAGPEPWLRLVHGAWAAAGEALEGAHSLFLHDMARAWRACAAADREATARGEPAPYLGGEVRCALVEASLHSLAGNILPALLAALVEKGVWTPAQGLAYARQMPDPRQQAEALGKLAHHLPPDLLPQALAAARNIRDADARTRALAALAPHLPPDERPQVLAEALASGLAELPRPALYSLWGETLPRLARRTRSDLLADLQGPGSGHPRPGRGGGRRRNRPRHPGRDALVAVNGTRNTHAAVPPVRVLPGRVVRSHPLARCWRSTRCSRRWPASLRPGGWRWAARASRTPKAGMKAARSLPKSWPGNATLVGLPALPAALMTPRDMTTWHTSWAGWTRRPSSCRSASVGPRWPSAWALRSRKGKRPAFAPTAAELAAAFALLTGLGRAAGALVAADDDTRRRLGLSATCGEGFVRIALDGSCDRCCFPTCEFRSARMSFAVGAP